MLRPPGPHEGTQGGFIRAGSTWKPSCAQLCFGVEHAIGNGGESEIVPSHIITIAALHGDLDYTTHESFGLRNRQILIDFPLAFDILLIASSLPSSPAVRNAESAAPIAATLSCLCLIHLNPLC